MGALVLALLLAGDAADREAALGRTLDALWAGLGSAPGQGADAAAVAPLFHPDARVLGFRFTDGRAELRSMTGAEFVERQAKPRAAGFHEREVHRQVVRYSHLAHVFSTVESRDTPGQAAASFTGVNSLQLAWNGERWAILSLYYHLEDPAEPIPPGLRSGL